MATKKEKKEQLNSLKLNELKALCKSRGYEKFSSMSKSAIVDFIIKMEDEAPAKKDAHKPLRQFRKLNKSFGRR